MHSVAELEQAAQVHIERTYPLPLALMTTIGCAAASCDAAGLADIPGTPLVIAGAAVTGAGVLALSAERAHHHKVLHAGLVHHLAQQIGPVKVKLTGWTGWPVGTPTAITLRYSHRADPTTPGFAEKISNIVGVQLGAIYNVTSHDIRKRRLQLDMSTSSPEATRSAERTTVIAHRLLSEACNITIDNNADGDIAQLHVQLDPTALLRVATPAQRTRIERNVSTFLPGRWRARWDLQQDNVLFEPRPEFGGKVPRPTDTSHNMSCVPIGVDEDGAEIVWNYSPKGAEPHHIVVGTTGSGKTSEMHGLVAELTKQSHGIFIVDPKQVEFLGYRTWPNVQYVATTVPEMVAVITHFHDIMESRYRQIVEGAISEKDLEPVFLFLDEFRNFHRQVTAWWKHLRADPLWKKLMPTGAPPVLDLIEALAEKGRTSRTHLVVGTQRPDAEWFGGDMRDNFRSRVATGRLSPQGAQMMFNNSHSGTSVPLRTPGRATSLNANDEPVELQVYWCPDPRTAYRDNDTEDITLLEQLKPATVTHERLVIIPPDQDAYEDGRCPGYDDWAHAEWTLASNRPDLDGISLPHTRQRAGTSPYSAPDNTDDHYEEDITDHYEEDGTETPVEDLCPGDLVETEPGVWYVVEAAEPDPCDENGWCLDLRDNDSGEPSMLSLATGEYLIAKKPKNI